MEATKCVQSPQLAKCQTPWSMRQATKRPENAGHKATGSSNAGARAPMTSRVPSETCSTTLRFCIAQKAIISRMPIHVPGIEISRARSLMACCTATPLPAPVSATADAQGLPAVATTAVLLCEWALVLAVSLAGKAAASLLLLLLLLLLEDSLQRSARPSF